MFVQDPPQLRNRWRTDRALRYVVERLLPEDVLADAAQQLDALGERTGGELAALARRAEAHPPRHVPYDAWGNRVDRVEVDPAWTRLVVIGAEAGLVATAYEPRWGAAARVVQVALLQLFESVSAVATCPLAMTDGAARCLLATDPPLAERWVPRLLARRDGVTSGQWMTEQTGGSDVGGTATVARPLPDGTWALTGTKWFTSATTADIALALARPVDAAEPGSRGLSLFLVELRRPDGSWNGLVVRRLKDKLGTRALPTAELDLVDTVATPVGGIGRGVAKIAEMLPATRLWTAHGGVAPVAHLLDLARDYAQRRTVFGAPLAAKPLHRAWLGQIAATYHAMLALLFRTAELVGRAECSRTDLELARVVVPLAKLACSRQGVWASSELLESFGGAGYLEDTGIPAVFRNGHVNVIWEGASSVMAHDVLRALRDPRVGDAFLADLDERLAAGAAHPDLEEPARRVRAAADELKPLLAEPAEGSGRRLAWGMARTYEAALLVEAAAWAHRVKDDFGPAAAARRFTAEPLLDAAHDLDADEETALALG